MKHILILLSLLILTSPLVAQETGVLYFKKVNGKFGWFENGNDKKDWKYIGEIKKGKPNGIGVLSSTFGFRASLLGHLEKGSEAKMVLDIYLALRPNLKTREDYRNSFITNSVLADTIIEGLINGGSTRRLKHFQNTPSSPVSNPH